MDKKTPLRFCGGIFFALILKARRKPYAHQEDCFRDLMVMFDRSVKGLHGNSRKTIASRFKNCDAGLDSEYIRFGDEAAVTAFRERIKRDRGAVLREMCEFVDGAVDVEAYGEWLVRAVISMIEADESISANTKLYIMPGNLPVYKSDLGDLRRVYFYDLLLGVWEYVCTYCRDNGVGAETYLAITEDAGRNKGRIVRSGIGVGGRGDIEIVFECPDGGGEEADAAAGAAGRDGAAGACRSAGSCRRYENYLKRAEAKFRDQKTFLYETRRYFYDFFVCSDICKRYMMRIGGRRGRSYEDAVIRDVTIEKLAARNRFVILSGTGGIGKSMLMRHLMLDTIRGSVVSGRIPVLANIRDYDPGKGDVIDFLYDSFRRHDPELKLADLISLLIEGRAVILLDGLDEVKSGGRDDLIREVCYMVDSYPDAVYVISSRPTINMRAFERFTVYDLMHFDKAKAISMVSKLDEAAVDAETKQDFIRDIEDDRFRFSEDERIEFLGNPLLLTIMMMTYAETHDVPKRRYLFYEAAYEAMARKHDATKNLRREFATGLDADEFKYYFGEFCALTYEQDLYELNQEEMEANLRKVIQMNGLDVNPADFVEDVTGKICVMHLDGGEYCFVHRSFQEYFAAYFFSRQLEQNYDAVLDMLRVRDEFDHDSMILPMMYAMDRKKTERCILLPFLKEYLDVDEGRGYRDFLCAFYPLISIAQGDIDDRHDNHANSMIYRFFADRFGLHREIHGNRLPWIEAGDGVEMLCYGDGPESDVLLFNCDGAEGCAAGDVGAEGVRGHVVPMDVSSVFESPDAVEAVNMIEDDGFPLREEFYAARKKYREMKSAYEKKSRKMGWIERFH